MKRNLTLALGLITFAGSFASVLQGEYPDEPFRGFSPDGKWAVCDNGTFNPLVIKNLETGAEFTYSETYSEGSGNFLSNTGVVVGFLSVDDVASYWQNGEWKFLPIPPNTTMSFANGITPDGRRIAGDISPADYMGNYDGLMTIPCIWDLQPDGTYSEPIMLPYPEFDFTDRTPQYVTAVRISDDGKTIAGQVKDFVGMVCQPIVYTENSDGNWEYKLLVDELFHPEGYDLPSPPEDSLPPTAFMTPEEVAAFNAALEDWILNGNEDYDIYPNIQDFMTPEEWEAYEQYILDWNEQYLEFDIALWELIAAVPNFSYNNVFLTSDGKYYASTDAKFYEDELTGFRYKEFVPYLIDIENDSYKKFPAVDDVNIMLSSLIDDGTMLGQWNDEIYGIYNGYILQAGNTEFIPLYDFVKIESPETAAWMEENMTHTYMEYDFSDMTSHPATILATGIPFSTPDMSLIGFAQYNFWDQMSSVDTYTGYLITLNPFSGVEEIGQQSIIKIRSIGQGDLELSGNIKNIEIYDFKGMRLFSQSEPGNLISTTLPAGLYILRLTDERGNIEIAKIRIR